MSKARKALGKLARGEWKELAHRAKEERITLVERRRVREHREPFAPALYSQIFRPDFLDSLPPGGGEPDLTPARGRHSSLRFFPGFHRLASGPEALRTFVSPECLERIRQSADLVLANRFPIFHLGHVSFGDPVRWNLDPLSGREAPDGFYRDVPYLDPATGDSKVIWEPSRFQWVFDLGIAYVLTGNEAYPRKFFQLLQDWKAKNPVYRGVHWCSALESAFRVHSLLWGLHYFHGSRVATTQDWSAWYAVVYSAVRYVEDHLSLYFAPNTHILGEALALFMAGHVLPEFRKAAQWRELGSRTFREQLALQMTAEGMHAERSTAYHAYTLEFALAFHVLNRREGDGDPDPAARSDLDLLAGCLRCLERPDHQWPQMGDEDGGRFFFLSRQDPRDYAGLLEAVETWLAGTGTPPRSLESFWLGSPTLQKGERAQWKGSQFLPETGLIVSRSQDGSMFSLLQGGPFGYLDAPHSHADMLHLEICVGGDPFLVDPGTLVYTGDLEQRNRFRSADKHNGPRVEAELLDPGDPFAWNEKPDCRFRVPLLESGFDLARGEFLVNPDGGHPCRIERSVFFNKGRFWIVHDRISSQRETEVSWSFISPFRISTEESRAVFHGSETRLAFRVSGVPQPALSVHEAGDMIAGGYLSPRPGWNLDVRSSRARAHGVFFLFIPQNNNDSEPGLLEAVSSDSAARCSFADADGLHLFAVKDQGAVFDDLDTDADALYLLRSATGITRLVMCGGSRLHWGGKALASLPKRERYLDVHRIPEGPRVEPPALTEHFNFKHWSDDELRYVRH